MRQRFGAKDIYDNQGEKVLENEDLKGKKLRNVNDDSVVKSLKDITGEVVDEHGATVITQAQFDAGLKEKVRESGEAGGGPLSNLLKELIASPDSDQLISSNLHATATDVAAFDNITRRSIIEVIPGYLARILEQATNMATGYANERLVYSTEREQFVTQSAQDQMLADKLFAKDAIAERRKQAEAIATDLTEGTELSKEAQELLVNTLLYNRDTGGRFSFDRLAGGEAFREGEDANAQAELEAFAQTLLEDRDYVLEQRLNARFKHIANGEQATLDALRGYAAVGDKDALRRIRLVDNSVEGDVVNNAARLEMAAGRREATVGSAEPLPRGPVNGTGPLYSAGRGRDHRPDHRLQPFG